MEKNLEIRKKSDEIIRMYRDKLIDKKDIGKLFGVSEKLIYNILKENKAMMNSSERKKILFENGKIIPSMLGKHPSKESIEKNRQSNKGIQAGEKNAFYGKEHTSEAKLKMSQSRIGKHPTEETRKKMSLIRKGKPSYERTEEIKLKMSLAKLGKPNLKLKGIDFSEEHRKKLSAAKQGITIEEWKKFVSQEPYDERWTPAFRNLIRKRDNQVCMNCGIHREKLNKALNVHHINSDKKMSIQENCVSLCDSCHALTLVNREYWQKLLQEKLSKLYNYKYSEEGQIILNLNEVKN